MISVVAFASMFVLGLYFHIVVSSSAGSAPPLSQGGCLETTMKGDWGFSSEGRVEGFDATTHFASMGLMTFDGEGKIYGTETLNVTHEVKESYLDRAQASEDSVAPGISRRIRERSFTGTYTVKPNCTGSITVVYDNGEPPVRADFVVVQGGRECLFLSRDKAPATGIAKRQ